MTAYYNEFEPFAAAVLRELIKAGAIEDGEVDERDIQEVKAEDLEGFTQVHLFAGFGVWSHALRCSGWPDDRPVWTASCPCPPFSSAGLKKACPQCGGTNPVPHVGRTGYFVCCLCQHEWLADERHLWPEVWRLVRDARPGILFGEQVSSGDGRVWFSSVRGSLEILGYGCRGADVCAAGFKGFHIRQRIYFVAKSCHEGSSSKQAQSAQSRFANSVKSRSSADGRVANSNRTLASEGRLQRIGELRQSAEDDRSGRGNGDDVLANSYRIGAQRPGTEEQQSISGCTSSIMAESDNSERWPDMAGRNILNGSTPGRNESDCESGASSVDGRMGKSDSPGSLTREQAEQTGGHGSSIITTGDSSGVDVTEHSIRRTEQQEHRDAYGRGGLGGSSHPDQLGNSQERGLGTSGSAQRECGRAAQPEASGELDESECQGWKGGVGGQQAEGAERSRWDEVTKRSNLDCLWLPCRDPKHGIVYRPVERISESYAQQVAPETAADLGFVLLEGQVIVAPLIEKGKNRVGRLRGYGNRLDAATAQAFVESVMECL